MSIAQRLAALTGRSRASRPFDDFKTMLDSTSINFMMADNDGIIRYMNKATEALMRRSEANMREIFPHFSADQIIGANFDIFHKHPSHQRNILAKLTGLHVSNIELGGLSFRLCASPIINAKGERQGTVLEWIDRTAEVKSISSVVEVLDAVASQGDFSKRVDVAALDGFYKQTGEGLNQLVAGVTMLIADMNHMSREHDAGDIDVVMDSGKFKGDFKTMAQGINTMVLGHIAAKKNAMACIKELG